MTDTATILTSVKDEIAKVMMDMPEFTRVSNDWIDDSDKEPCLHFRLRASQKQHYHFRRYLHLNHPISVITYSEGMDTFTFEPKDEKATDTDHIQFRYKIYDRATQIEFKEGEIYNIGMQLNPKYDKLADGLVALDKYDNVLLPESDTPNKKISGATVVLTGKLTRYTRTEAEDIITKLGGFNSNKVSYATDYVILGDKPGKKEQDALDKGINIMDEQEFYDIVDANGL
jgi:NAD-dependent DNA ligase